MSNLIIVVSCEYRHKTEYSLSHSHIVFHIEHYFTKRTPTPHPHPSPDREVQGDNMGPTWVLSAPDGTPVAPMNLVIRAVYAITHGDIVLFGVILYWQALHHLKF